MSGRRGAYTRIVAWTTLVSSLTVLFLNNLGTVTLDVSTYLKGFILLGAGAMMLFETFFTKSMSWEDPYSINFLIGIPSGLIAVLLGLGYVANYSFVVKTFGGFEGGIYLAGIIILAYEGVTAAAEKNINLRDFRDN